LEGWNVRTTLIVTIRVKTSNGDVLVITVEIPIIASPARPVWP
jgi:hypothetical protein